MKIENHLFVCKLDLEEGKKHVKANNYDAALVKFGSVYGNVRALLDHTLSLMKVKLERDAAEQERRE